MRFSITHFDISAAIGEKLTFSISQVYLYLLKLEKVDNCILT